MAVQQQKKINSSIFPDLPREAKAVESDGKLTQLWRLSISNLYQSLQRNFSNEGFNFPPLTGEEIAIIENNYKPYIGKPLPQNVPDISGRNVFDSTARVPKIFIITYNTSVQPNTILTAAWKTYTVT